MKKNGLVFAFLLCTLFVGAQMPTGKSFIRDMQWGPDDRIHLTLFNDSGYYLKIKDIIHANTIQSDTVIKDFVYYPAMLARDFVERLNEVKVNEGSDNDAKDLITTKPMSLWGALHSSIGGGWVHFENCLLYSLETRYISLTAPLMERPKTKWKPNPLTETYKRTRKWKYYAPVDQKQAQAEYKLKEKENQLSNLRDIPPSFIKLFLETSNRKYRRIVASNDYHTQARIDLVKLLLGASYLGETQITYVKAMVKKAVSKYSYSQLPTVIVFDDVEAAAVLTLNEGGYRIEKVVFRNVPSVMEDEKANRQIQIERSVQIVNKMNQKIFEERLKRYNK
jgi:hypothetical protein